MRAPGGTEPPVAEGRPDPFAAGLEQADHLVDRFGRPWVEPRDLLSARGKERAEDVVDPVLQSDRIGRRGARGGSHRGQYAKEHGAGASDTAVGTPSIMWPPVWTGPRT